VKMMERAKEDKSGLEGVIKLTTEIQTTISRIGQEYNLSV